MHGSYDDVYVESTFSCDDATIFQLNSPMLSFILTLILLFFVQEQIVAAVSSAYALCIVDIISKEVL